MGRKKTFGTHAFGGLNTKSAPHLLDDHELQECVNASFDEAGAVSPLGGDENLYDGLVGNAGVQIKALRRGGAEYLYWVSDTDIYEDDTIIGAGVGAEDARPMLSDGEHIYFLDDSDGQVWDGAHMRDHGGPAGVVDDNDSAYALRVDTNPTITSATDTDPIVITTLAPHLLYVGARVTLRNMTGGSWSGLDDSIQTITEVGGANEFTIDKNGASLGTFTGGSIQAGPGNTGDYQYAAQTVVVFPDGHEVGSPMVRLWNWSGDSASHDPVTLTGNEYASLYLDTDGDQITGYASPATGLEVKLRVYRTKSGGATYYLLREIDSADFDVNGAFQFRDGASDPDLGAVWLYDLDANGAPPAATLGAIVQQELFLAGVSGAETNLYFSKIYDYDHFKPTDYIDVEAWITALAPLADRVAVFTSDRIGTYSPIDEIGQFQWSLSPVGTDQWDSIVVTDSGILFARDDGLWLFDGVTSREMSEAVSDDWSALTGPWTVAKTPDKVYCAASDGDLVASIIGGKWRWSLLSGDLVERICASTDGMSLYGLDDNVDYDEYGVGPVSVFTGDNRTLTIKTKDFGGWKTWEGLKLVIDADSSGEDFAVTVETNHGESRVISVTGEASRHRYRELLPPSLRGEYFNVEIVGDVTVYGVEMLLQ